jgi:hypothetical protein
MNDQVRTAILDLCDTVINVINNNDWPTEDGRLHDDGVTCTCPLLERVNFIKSNLKGEKIS